MLTVSSPVALGARGCSRASADSRAASSIAQRRHVPSVTQWPSGSPLPCRNTWPCMQCASGFVGSTHETRCQESGRELRDPSRVPSVCTRTRQYRRCWLEWSEPAHDRLSLSFPLSRSPMRFLGHFLRSATAASSAGDVARRAPFRGYPRNPKATSREQLRRRPWRQPPRPGVKHRVRHVPRTHARL